MSYTYRPKPVRVVLPSNVPPADLEEMRADAREAHRLGRSVEWIASRLGVSVEVVRSWIGKGAA